MLFTLAFVYYWAPVYIGHVLEIDKKGSFDYSMLNVFVHVCIKSFLYASLHQVFCYGGASLVKMWFCGLGNSNYVHLPVRISLTKVVFRWSSSACVKRRQQTAFMGLWLALFSMALLIVTLVCHTSRKEKHSSLMHIIFAFKKKSKNRALYWERSLHLKGTFVQNQLCS